MKHLYSLFAFTCLIGVSFESCRFQLFDGNFCTAPNGVTIPVHGELKMPEKCEECSCRASSTSTGTFMSCCGYGIHAGSMVPPQGCKLVADVDGCTPKFVLLSDESKLCTHK